MGGCQRGTPIVRRTPTIFKIRSCCFADQYIICISEMRILLGFGFMRIRGKKYQPLNLYIFWQNITQRASRSCMRTVIQGSIFSGDLFNVVSTCSKVNKYMLSYHISENYFSRKYSNIYNLLYILNFSALTHPEINFIYMYTRFIICYQVLFFPK